MQVKKNAATMAKAFMDKGYKVISGEYPITTLCLSTFAPNSLILPEEG